MNLRNLRVEEDKLWIFVVWSAFVGQALSYSKIYFFHIASFLAFFYVVFIHSSLFRKIQFRKHLVFIYVFIWAFFSCFLSENISLSLKGLVYLCSGYAILASWNLTKEKSLLFKGLFILYILNLLLGLVEAFTPLRWPISSVSPWLELFGKERRAFYPETYEDYPTGFFWHPNNASLVVLMGFPLILRAPSLKPLLKILIVFSGLVFIIKAGAKALFILSLVYLSYFALSNLCLKKINTNKLVTGIISLSLLTILVISSLNYEQKQELRTSAEVVLNYVRTVWSIITNSSDIPNYRGEISERVRLLVGTLSVFKQHPFWGVGLNQLPGVTVTVAGIDTSLESPHFYWLEILASGGLVLAVPLFWWLSKNFFYLLKQKETHGLAEVLIIFIVGVVSMSSAVYFLPKWILYAMILDVKSDHHS